MEVAGSRMEKVVSHSLSHGDEKSMTCAQTNRFGLRGSITQLVGLGEDATQINAEVQVDVVQGLANEVRVQLPDKLTVNQVSGAMVADWDVAANELKVVFIEPVQKTARFTLTGELPMRT